MIETEVIQHQPEIAAVGFEIDVEHVAEHRMLPAAASTPMFVSILRSLSFGTPRCRASLTIRRLMAGAPKSPSPGINPSIESAPNEMLVPGTRSAVSISPANPRIRRSRTSRSIGMSCFLHSANPASDACLSCSCLLLAEAFDRLFECCWSRKPMRRVVVPAVSLWVSQSRRR